MILITGATGQFGRLTIEFLLSNGVDANQIAALARSAEKAEDLREKGIKIIVGDYNDYPSLVSAFKGIDKLLLISGTDLVNRTAQHQSLVKAAKEADVKHIAYTSGEFRSSSPDSPLWLFAEAHIKMEKWLKESGVTYTIFRNGLYMEYVPYFIGNVLETGTIYLPAGDGKISVALRSEMAEATALVLASDGHENKTYHFVNTEAYSYEEIAQFISESSGKDITYVSPTEQEFRETLKQTGASIPEEYIGIVLSQAQGDGDLISNDLERLIGRKLTALKDYLQQVYKRS